MYKKTSILALGLDKLHFQEKFENYYNEFKNLNYLLSFNKIPNSLSISKLDWIDSSKLYKMQRVFEAFDLSKKSTLDSNFLSKMYECESLFFSTLDRCSTEKRSQNENKSYFFDLLLFFKSFFELKKDITHVFFPSTPHFPVEIALFYVSKYFSINSIILNRTDFNNKFFFRKDWRLIHPFLTDFKYKSVDVIDLKEFEKNSNFVKFSQNLNKKSLGDFNKKTNTLLNYYKVFSFFKISIYFYSQRKFLSIFFLNNGVSWLSIFLSLFKKFNQNNLMKSYYKDHMRNPDLNKDFIYFPLHFQPERSTDPEGLFFSNQLRAIEILRKNFPKNFHIYVKEHPRQFDNNIPDLRKTSYRTTNFYKKIIDLPNTDIVNVNIDSLKLIQKSKFVATITGSSGWQALKYLKPVLIFGFPWYASFKGCFHVKNEFDIIQAIDNSNSSKNSFEKRDLSDYLEKINDGVFDDFNGSYYFDGDPDKYKKLVKNFAYNLNHYINITSN